jgi:uncharacterized protein (TIGR01370 family)
MRRARLMLVLSALLALTVMAGAADARQMSPRLAKVRSWAFAIGDGAANRNLSRYGLVVVDGADTSSARVRQLRRGGRIVLGYLSVGTIEKGRWWFAAASPYRLELWQDWGEWYADTSAPGFRRLIADRVAPRMLAKGFDGLFLDNVDMIKTHPGRTAGMRSLVAALASRAHRRDGFLFAQNGEDVIGPMLRFLDGWNREDVTGTYDFDAGRYVVQPAAETASAQAALRRIRRAGVLVTATDYFASGATAGAQGARRNACAAGALPFVSDIELTRVPATPLRCSP